SNAVQVDHVVALSDAWQKGAQGWDEAKRVAFANDPLELLAVDGPLNAQKGDGDAATWLPPNGTFRCTYVARQVAIKATWGLWLTSAEKDAMAGILTGCPEQPLPTTTSVSAAATPPGGVVVGEPVADVPVAIPTQSSVAEPTTAAPVLEPAPLDGSAVSYVNCAAVRAAGAAPIHTGEPGYSHKLDRDGDGVACE
ncbi:MAG: excalibur calcium-binding domain-containing protein, partial [Janthinobacterium lividum]